MGKVPEKGLAKAAKLRAFRRGVNGRLHGFDFRSAPIVYKDLRLGGLPEQSAEAWSSPGRLFYFMTRRRGLTVYALYLDDAGSVGNPAEKHFILAGVCLFERQIHWLQDELDRVARTTTHHSPETLELHGNQILAGRNWWRSVPKEERRRVIRHGLAAARALKGDWCLFGVVVDKQERAPEDPIEYAFEQLCNRFDRYLMRKHRQGNSQKGIIVLDKSTRETRLQSLATEFKNTGHRWGTTKNIADVPFFVDSRATRLIQYADLVSYALWQKFEKGDDEFFDVISDSFDTEGAVVHGLHHFKNRQTYCDCPACAPTLLDRL